MPEEKVILPDPVKKSTTSIEEALKGRRSVRSFKDLEADKEVVSQLLWAAQGITENETGSRTAPSAGGTYPLEVYLVVRKVKTLDPGVYHYIPGEHSLVKIKDGYLSNDLATAALGQSFVGNASFNIVLSGVYGRTIDRYDERGERYVHMEVGHAAQNVYLQCESLDLGAVVVGAFDDERVKKALELSKAEVPLYIISVGKR
ncbi:MAG: SagB/ThcOx family dehydrogenase, partial [Candidatus Paceibacterota bacterium]